MRLSYIRPLKFKMPCQWCSRRMGTQNHPFAVVIAGYTICRKCARPCKVDWIRDVVRQCANASVPCFVKQLGAVVIEPNCMCYGNLDGGPNCKLCGCRRFLAHPKGGDPAEWPDDLRVRQFPEVVR